MKEKILNILEKSPQPDEELADEIYKLFEKHTYKIAQISGLAKGLSEFRNIGGYSEEGLKRGLLKIEKLADEFLNYKD